MIVSFLITALERTKQTENLVARFLGLVSQMQVIWVWSSKNLHAVLLLGLSYLGLHMVFTLKSQRMIWDILQGVSTIWV